MGNDKDGARGRWGRYGLSRAVVGVVRRVGFRGDFDHVGKRVATHFTDKMHLTTTQCSLYGLVRAGSGGCVGKGKTGNTLAGRRDSIAPYRHVHIRAANNYYIGNSRRHFCPYYCKALLNL